MTYKFEYVNDSLLQLLLCVFCPILILLSIDFRRGTEEKKYSWTQKIRHFYNAPVITFYFNVVSTLLYISSSCLWLHKARYAISLLLILMLEKCDPRHLEFETQNIIETLKRFIDSA